MFLPNRARLQCKEVWVNLDDKGFTTLWLENTYTGPTRIAMKREDPAGLEPGMFFSDEPGYYQVD